MVNVKAGGNIPIYVVDCLSFGILATALQHVCLHTVHAQSAFVLHGVLPPIGADARGRLHMQAPAWM